MKLKSRMTVGEMSEHLTEHTGKFANRVSVGRYAKKLGYAVYKPMINGRICQFYVNPSIKDDGEAETLRTNERENGHEREGRQKATRDTVYEMLHRAGRRVHPGRGHLHAVHGRPYTPA